MKICLYGIDGLALGKHNVKDPRLDQADKLVEAKKKTYVQVDLVAEAEIEDAEAILAHTDRRADLVLRDLEFIELRLGREPSPVERSAMEKLRTALEAEQFVSGVVLTPDEVQCLASYRFVTAKPIVLGSPQASEAAEPMVVDAYHAAGYLSFLTVGGKENRAWSIRQGATAWEAAGAIHTDMQRGFIRAEIISFADLVAAGGETEAKRAGKLRLETKQYVMQDYDVANFRFNK